MKPKNPCYYLKWRIETKNISIEISLVQRNHYTIRTVLSNYSNDKSYSN